MWLYISDLWTAIRQLCGCWFLPIPVIHRRITFVRDALENDLQRKQQLPYRLIMWAWMKRLGPTKLKFIKEEVGDTIK